MANSYLDRVMLDAKNCSRSKWKRKSNLRSVVGKSVLILAGGDDDGCGGKVDRRRRDTEWYVVNVTSSDRSKKKNRKSKWDFEDDVCVGPLRRPNWRSEARFASSYARIGSNVYCIGGGLKRRNEYSSRVDVGNLTKTLPPLRSVEWESIPNMNSQRKSAQAVVVDGKLYVFGGTKSESVTPWAEVYDPKQQSWTPLPEPPSHLCSKGFFAAHDSSSSTSKKIVLGSCFSPFLISYDVLVGNWETITRDFHCFSAVCRPVLHENKLYWFAGRVGVYDLDCKEMFSGPIKGYFDDNLRSDLDPCYEPVIFHIDGDEFLCIWLNFHCGDRLADLCSTTIRICNGSVYFVEGRSLFTRTSPIHRRPTFLCGLLLDETVLSTDAPRKSGSSTELALL